LPSSKGSTRIDFPEITACGCKYTVLKFRSVKQKLQICSIRSPSFDKGCSDHQSPFWIFVLVGATTSFPQTAPNVDDIFEPVTWHHQRRPFIRALSCKIGKTHRGVAGGASSDDQVSPMFVRRGERERGSQRKMNCPIIISILPFYTPMCYMSLLPLSSTGLHVDVSYLP
jgi:hypothetical protein